MSAVPFTLLVCTNLRPSFDKPSCAGRGAEKLADAIEDGIRERGLAVTVLRKCCLGQCEDGPTLRLIPGGDFLLGVRPDDVERVLDHLEKVCGREEKNLSAPVAETRP